MVEYTINAVNTLLVNLREDTYTFLGKAINEFLEEKIPTPYTKEYLKMIRERAQDINFLGRDITQLTRDEINERLHTVLDDIIMVHGSVNSLIHIREHHEKMGELEPNEILDLLRKYSEALDNYSEGINDLIS